MSSRSLFVYVDLGGKPLFAGQLWARFKGGRESSSFQYAESFLSHPERFALEPALQLTEGVYHTGADRPLLGAIGDSAPDRWGRLLMRRSGALLTRAANREPRTLTEVDYLLGVCDEARQGALRFSEVKGAPFLALSGTSSIPPLSELPKLLSAAENVLEEKESAEDLRLLLAPGSSLGGAGPKASLRGLDGELAIAKFPSKDDSDFAVEWEAVALTLARSAGLHVPEWRLEAVGDRRVLLIKRFDRCLGKRVPSLSAMSMLGARDHESHSYLEIADALRQYGASPKEDIEDLWKRIVFSILISNTDDHLRNHGFLYERREKGWRLSPLYDVNPTPAELKPRVLTTTIDLEDATASLDLALSVAPLFGLTQEVAKSIAKEVGGAVAHWREEARRFRIQASSVERMASAFNHKDLRQALSF